MAARSRRKAREAALRTLYEVELGDSWPSDALREASEHAALDAELHTYLEVLVWGVEREKEKLDAELAPLLRGYGLDRLAAIDRSVLRIAAYEISFQPAVPPAVSINEAVDLAKKYSTAESGRFVNGVLAKYLEGSPKANWDPAAAPPEIVEMSAHEPEPEVECETVAEDSPEAAEARRIGAWKLKTAADDGAT